MASCTYFLRHGTKQTTDIVLSILRAHKSGLTTKEIYEKAHIAYPNAFEEAPPPKPLRFRSARGTIIQPAPAPGHPNHPIRSVKYLKTVVLKELQQHRWIEKFITHVPVHPATKVKQMTEDGWTVPVWRWRMLEAESEESRRAKVWSAQRKNPLKWGIAAGPVEL